MKRKLGLYIGDAAGRRQAAVREAIRLVHPGIVLLMENAFWVADELPQDCFVIGRAFSLADHVRLPPTEAECKTLGTQLARSILARYGHLARIDAWMDQNEPAFPDDETAALHFARRLGAWGAGFAEIMQAANKLPILWNFSMGTPEPRPFRACLLAFRQHYTGQWPNDLFIGYHGYTVGEARQEGWYECRPWEMWERELQIYGMKLLGVIFTECGYDARIGWRGRWTPREYAEYMAALPDIAPEAEGYTLFTVGGTDDWVEKGYDLDPVSYPEDAIVLRAMGAKNDELEQEEEDTPMPTPDEWESQQVLDIAYEMACGEGYNEHTGIARYAAEHPEVGAPMPALQRSPGGAIVLLAQGEYTRSKWPYVLRNYSNAIVAYRKADGYTTHVSYTAAGIDSLPKA